MKTALEISEAICNVMFSFQFNSLLIFSSRYKGMCSLGCRAQALLAKRHKFNTLLLRLEDSTAVKSDNEEDAESNALTQPWQKPFQQWVDHETFHLEEMDAVTGWGVCYCIL